MTNDQYVHSKILVELENTNIVKEVRISIPIYSISTFYEYPCDLDDSLKHDATKVFCDDDTSFILLMPYDEFAKVYFAKLEKLDRLNLLTKFN